MSPPPSPHLPHTLYCHLSFLSPLFLLFPVLLSKASLSATLPHSLFPLYFFRGPPFGAKTIFLVDFFFLGENFKKNITKKGAVCHCQDWGFFFFHSFLKNAHYFVSGKCQRRFTQPYSTTPPLRCRENVWKHQRSKTTTRKGRGEGNSDFPSFQNRVSF